MQNMASPNPFHDHATNDSVSSPYAPLLDSGGTPAIEAPQRRRQRRRPSTIVLLLMTGLLAVALFMVVALVTNGNKQTKKVSGQQETRRQQKNMIPANRGVAEGVSSKSFGLMLGSSAFSWSNKLLAWQRTAFHFQPRKNWMNDPNGPVLYKGWASVQAIPRTILLDTKTGSNIIQWPVQEVESLRMSKKVFEKVETKPGSVVSLDVGSVSQLDIMAEFEVDQNSLEGVNSSDTTYNCTSSGGAAQRGALGPFGLLVHANNGLTEQTPIYFYISKDKQGNFKTFFCADHSRSSEAFDVDKAIYGSTVPVLKGEKLSMRILVDHSIVESFAQGGRTCITSRIYPTKAINEDARIFLFNNATDVGVTASLQIWQMSSAYAST